MSSYPAIVVEPTADQVERFRRLSPAERYQWYVGVLRTTHGLATSEARERWRAVKQAQSGGFLSVVSAFVWALDRADFEEAARWVSSECIYDTGRAELTGVETILGSYSANHGWATRTFERIRYRSHVEGEAPGVAVVTFEDHTEHRGLAHRYRCQQEMHVGRSRLVERIVHREIEGQREALNAFFEKVGVRR